MDWKHFIIQMICILHWLLGEKTAMCLSAKCQDGGEGRVRCVERVTWKLTLPNITQIANGNLLYGSGNSHRGSVSTQMGGLGRKMGVNFRREGIYVYLCLIRVEV